MNPTSFNQKITEAIVTNMDTYMGESKMFGEKIPKINYVYSGFLTTCIPYTVANWGIRIAIFRKLNVARESTLEQAFVTYTSAFMAGMIGSFLTVPLYKLYISNHHLQSMGKNQSDFKTIYDSFFIETKFKSNKSSLKNKLSIWYRYSSEIALRGGFQSLIALGSYSFSVHLNTKSGNCTLDKDEYSKYITSTNPILDKLKSFGYFRSENSEKQSHYIIILKASIYAGILTSAVM
mmetsp:Transcript_25544/g.22698  ORF Transcript_25544/g.22698 Transcript_25544/m.22698 type:complete len:235 (+) Transcript_25544:259-963(+)